MSPTLPRQLVHRGSVVAAAILLDREALGEDAVRKRVLALWRAGASLSTWEGWYLLRLPKPLRVQASRCAGAPLVSVGGALLSAPLSAEELRALAPPEGALVIVHAARAQVVRRGELAPIDPASWLDLSGLEVLRPAPIVRPPAPVEDVIGEVPIDVAATLEAAVGPTDPARAGALAALVAAMQRGRGAPGAGDAGDVGAVGAAGAGPDAHQGDAGAPTDGALGPIPPAGRSWLDRMLDRAWEVLNPGRFGALGRWLGRQQASYLHDLLRRLESDDLDEALRRAIPLGGTGDGSRPPLGAPKRRSDLALSPAPPGASGGAIGLQKSLYEHLRGLYRDAFTRLDRADRVEEASFVLLELLGQVEEAVAYLESRDRYDLAAGIAEGRGLQPERVVRLWWLAGEPDRAIALARLHGAFAGAVARLEEGHPEEAEQLRVVWSRSLARSGRYLQAVEVLGIERAPRSLVRSALDQGGVEAATLSGRLLSARPELQDLVEPVIRAVLADRSPSTARERVALYAALADGEEPSPEAAPLLRLATRACAVDRAASVIRADAVCLGRLAQRSGDAALGLDVSRLPAPPRLAVPTTLAVTEPGGLGSIYDAVRLPDGSVLAACGDAGLRLLGPSARFFDVPAHALVVSEQGGRIIAAARRGGDWQLHRIDTGTWATERWATHRIERFARTFDGDGWFIAEGDEVLAVDALAEGWRSLWRVSGLGSDGDQGRVKRIWVDRSLSFLVEDLLDERSVHHWSYERSSLTLRRRAPVPWDSVDVLAPFPDTLSVAGGVLFEAAVDEGGIVLRRQPGGTVALGEAPGRLIALEMSAGGVGALTFRDEAGEDHLVIGNSDGVVLLQVALGALVMSLRWQEERLIIADTLGRASVIDVRQGLVEAVWAV